MKIIVFSDSHGNTANMVDAVRREEPEQIIHLGDVVRDAEELARQFPQLPVASVRGNCDGFCDIPVERLITVCGKKILMMHGHTCGVKSGTGAAVASARKAQADVLLFGHTHRAFCDLMGELWVLNPGSIGSLYESSYGIIRISQSGMVCYTELF